MLEKIEATEVRALADSMAEKAPNLRVAFEGKSKPEGDGFFHLELDGKQVGREFGVYSIMAGVKGEAQTSVDLLLELVIPLQDLAPEAFQEGIRQLREFDVFFDDDKRGSWVEILDGYSL